MITQRGNYSAGDTIVKDDDDDDDTVAMTGQAAHINVDIKLQFLWCLSSRTFSGAVMIVNRIFPCCDSRF